MKKIKNTVNIKKVETKIVKAEELIMDDRLELTDEEYVKIIESYYKISKR